MSQLNCVCTKSNSPPWGSGRREFTDKTQLN
jgi:hypothetical protein